MKLRKFLIVCEYADPEQYGELPEDITWDEQQVFAWDEDAGYFVQYFENGNCETINQP